MIFKSSGRSEDYWISVADLMAALMVIFLFIAINFWIKVNRQFEAFIYIQKEYVEAQEAIYKKLESEFENDLKMWDANIDKETLAVIFHEPETIFEKGEAIIKTVYQEILSDFFPRYIKALTRTDYTNFISKIRIEGHSSTEWTADTPSKIAYINNMDLSQRRASAVLRYVLDKVNIEAEYDWMKGHLLAVGYSSSENVLTSEGDEDREASRRVEFKVVMSAQEELFKIINGELPKDFERWNMSDEEKEEFRELFKTQKSVLKLRKAKN